MNAVSAPGNQWLTVTRPDAVALCLSAQYTPTLAELMLRESTVTELAARLHLALNAAHHRVRRLVEAGLVCQTRTTPRRGRPLRHYRAVSGAFLIPDHHTALDTLEELVGLHAQAGQERLNQAVVRAGLPLVQAQRDIGLRLYRDGDTVVYDVTPRAETFRYGEFLGPDFPALWVSWHELHLTRARAKRFQHELHALVGGYLKDSGPERYLLRADFVQDIQDNPAQAASGNERPVT